MYIRKTETLNKKTGATYFKHQLVESYRTDKGPRQRIVMELGNLDLPRSSLKRLAEILSSRLSADQSLFETIDPELGVIADEAMSNYDFLETKKSLAKDNEIGETAEVDLDSIETTHNRSLGAETVADEFYGRLGFDDLFKSAGMTNREASLSKAAIIARLIAPSSELASWKWMRNSSSLTEFCNVELTRVGKDAIYEIADTLLFHKKSIEKGLRAATAKLYPETHKILLYDLTNTYFEGSADNNSIAQFGRSKERRSDCKLVTLALVVDSYGFPVLSQIYKGNQSEPKTLINILDDLRVAQSSDSFEFSPTIIMDRGIATKENLELLGERKYHYIVIERRDVRKEHLDDFISKMDTFDKIEDSKTPVYIKALDSESGSRLLCYSTSREKKETSINEAKEARFKEDFLALVTSIKNGNIKKETKVGSRIGRLQERYPSISVHYEIELIYDESQDITAQKKVIDLNLTALDSKEDRDVLSGCYIIESDEKSLEPKEIWKLYMTLTKVEAAFRALKTDLGLRPVHHQLARRTEAHLFISVLAYHLLISIEHTLRKAGDKRSFSTIKKQLMTHQRSTVVFCDAAKRVHHIRLSSKPEPVHTRIYQLLGVKDKLKRKHEIVIDGL